MHEMSIALNIIEIAEEYARKAEAKKVNEIEIEVGRLSGVEIDALGFAMDTAKIGTILENSESKIIIVNAVGLCLDCNYEYEMHELFTACPKCGSYHIDILNGKELRVKSLNVD